MSVTGLRLKYKGLRTVNTYILAPATHGAIAILGRRTQRIEDNGRLENESGHIEDG